ncbi:MAG: MerR family DNA-binding transcriptional regulator [Myxococcota bacterium]
MDSHCGSTLRTGPSGGNGDVPSPGIQLRHRGSVTLRGRAPSSGLLSPPPSSGSSRAPSAPGIGRWPCSAPVSLRMAHNGSPNGFEVHVLKIGEVAKAAGVGIDAVRFYERQGLLAKPARRPSGYRE